MDANNQLLGIFSWLMIKTQKIQRQQSLFIRIPEAVKLTIAHALLLLNTSELGKFPPMVRLLGETIALCCRSAMD